MTTPSDLDVRQRIIGRRPLSSTSGANSVDFRGWLIGQALAALQLGPDLIEVRTGKPGPSPVDALASLAIGVADAILLRLAMEDLTRQPREARES